jgi:hypothetical protein
MINNLKRIGNFTSSEIYLLTKKSKSGGFGVPAITYIDDKKIEKKLGRSLQISVQTQSMVWGLFLEEYVNKLLSIEYELLSDFTIKHNLIENYSGSPDFTTNDTVCDLKCYQPKNFAKLTDAILKQDIVFFKENFESEYWQLISNSILTGLPYCEIISFMPYLSELPDLAILASNLDTSTPWVYRFISEGVSYNSIGDIQAPNLAYLPNNGYYKNLNKFRFEAPKEDKELLIELINKANILLNE